MSEWFIWVIEYGLTTCDDDIGAYTSYIFTSAKPLSGIEAVVQNSLVMLNILSAKCYILNCVVKWFFFLADALQLIVIKCGGRHFLYKTKRVVKEIFRSNEL